MLLVFFAVKYNLVVICSSQINLLLLVTESGTQPSFNFSTRILCIWMIRVKSYGADYWTVDSPSRDVSQIKRLHYSQNLGLY